MQSTQVCVPGLTAEARSGAGLFLAKAGEACARLDCGVVRLKTPGVDLISDWGQRWDQDDASGSRRDNLSRLSRLTRVVPPGPALSHV